MQKEIIQLIAPTMEIAARVISNPSIEVTAKSSELQLWMPIMAVLVSSVLAVIGACFVYWFAQRRPQEKAIRIAIKYELYRNFYQMIDMKRVAQDTLKFGRGTMVIYCEPYFTAFESMMGNGLISAFKNEECELFSIYDLIREYDPVYKVWINYVNKPENSEKQVEVYKRLIKIVDLAKKQEIKFEQYLAKSRYFSKKEWLDFIEENNKIWGEEQNADTGKVMGKS